MSDWQTSFTRQALDQVDTFITSHPEYTRHGVAQPGQGSTNRIVFARRDDDLVVFKVFCESERKQRSCFALEHWKDTGLVPLLIEDVSPDMIITTHISGTYLAEARIRDQAKVWHEAVRNTAIAIAALSLTTLNVEQKHDFETRFYQPLGKLEKYLNRILQLGWCIHVKDPAFKNSFWEDNLSFIEDQLPFILSQLPVLYHQDVSNLHVDQGRFTGFFDLEMCRVGSTAVQLGASLGMLEGNKQTWMWFRLGWEQGIKQKLSKQDLETAVAAYFLLGWREISRYLSYDGTPDSGYSWAQPADPTTYRNKFISAAQMLNVNLPPRDN